MQQKQHSIILLKTAFNALWDMPIAGSSKSAANKDVVSQTGQMGIQLSD